MAMPTLASLRRGTCAITFCGLLVAPLVGEPPTDPITANRQILREAFSAMDRQDYARFRELVPSDCLIQMVGEPEPLNVEALVTFLKDYWKAFPDTTHTLHRLLAEGDQLAVHTTCQGTHRGAFQGVAPTGKVIRYDGIHLVTFEKGRIKAWWVLDDNLGLMQQLGLRLSPSQGEGPEKGK